MRLEPIVVHYKDGTVDVLPVVPKRADEGAAELTEAFDSLCKAFRLLGDAQKQFARIASRLSGLTDNTVERQQQLQRSHDRVAFVAGSMVSRAQP